jgi:hypothetical protein
MAFFEIEEAFFPKTLAFAMPKGVFGKSMRNKNALKSK